MSVSAPPEPEVTPDEIERLKNELERYRRQHNGHLFAEAERKQRIKDLLTQVMELLDRP